MAVAGTVLGGYVEGKGTVSIDVNNLLLLSSTCFSKFFAGDYFIEDESVLPSCVSA